ncbi:hypothetical protein [Bradyrhizobium sp. USDA 4486]
MTETSFPAAALVGSRTAFHRRRRRKGLLEFLLQALHHSRRMQARRILGQYADLMAKPVQQVDSDMSGRESH